VAKVTKLQKIDQNKPVVEPSVVEPSTEPAAMPGTDQNRNCLFVLGYFVFVYLAMVLAFWMFGQITHQSDRRLGELHNAQNAAEIRDALAAEFGTPSWLSAVITPPKLPTAEEIISDSAAKLGDTITNATDSVTNATKEAVTSGVQEGADAAVQSVIPQ